MYTWAVILWKSGSFSTFWYSSPVEESRGVPWTRTCVHAYVQEEVKVLVEVSLRALARSRLYMAKHLAVHTTITLHTCLISNVLKESVSISTPAVGLFSPSPSAGLGWKGGSHCFTFLTMASTAWPAAIRVSQDLLTKYVLTYRQTDKFLHWNWLFG